MLAALGGNGALLQEVLEGKRSVINSCGSGMTAAVIWLALQELGADSAIYDEVIHFLFAMFIFLEDSTDSIYTLAVLDWVCIQKGEQDT